MMSYAYVYRIIFSILVYVEMGSGATDNAQLQFTFDATQTATSRNYEIKTSQIQCSNPNR